VKVTIIGGGSFQWVPNLVCDLLRTDALDGLDLALVDIDPRPLDPMAQWVRTAAEGYGRRVTVSTTTDRRAALAGSDAVVVTISTGGFASMAQDLAVPERFGFRQSVGDSVGPGGINRAVRNIPVLVGIARDMKQLCPDAWMLNITNPMTVLTRAVRKATGIKAVGLCHEITHVRWEVALLAQCGFEDTRPELVGVNHFPLVTKMPAGDRDGFEILRSVADGSFVDPPWANEHTSAESFRRRNQVKLWFFDRYGVLPAAGDRHLVEFVPGFLTPETSWGADWGVHLTTIADRERDQGAYVERLDKLLTGAEAAPQHDSGELVAPFLDSLVTGTSRRMPLNLPNVGQAPQLGLDAIVESMAVVDADGPHVENPVTAPAPLAELLRRVSVAQEHVVEAVLTADLDGLRDAHALDPFAGRGDQRDRDRMVLELLQATADWLSPEWQKVAAG
jgi:alpha-galactosidase/6-phospho-beta-glucosidase family protein